MTLNVHINRSSIFHLTFRPSRQANIKICQYLMATIVCIRLLKQKLSELYCSFEPFSKEQRPLFP